MATKKAPKKVTKKVIKPDEEKHPKMICWVSLALMFLCGWITKDLVAKVDCSDCNLRQEGLERRIEGMKPYNRNNTETIRQRSERFSNREKSNE